MDTFPRRGEIYLVKIPNKPDDGKERPALVVSMNARNKYTGDVIAVPVTTNLREAPTNVFLKKGTGGLRHDSMARCDQVTTLDKRFLLRGPFDGIVSEDLLRKVYQGISQALGYFDPSSI